MLELLTKQRWIEVYRLSYKNITKIKYTSLIKNSNTLLYKKKKPSTGIG